YHADDFKPRIREFVRELLELRNVHALAQRIFVEEIFVGEGLVDDGEFALPFDFGLGERTTVNELNFEDGEIALAAQLEEGVPFFGVSFAGNFNVGRNSTVGREGAGFGGFKETGQGFDAVEQRTEKAG